MICANWIGAAAGHVRAVSGSTNAGVVLRTPAELAEFVRENAAELEDSVPSDSRPMFWRSLLSHAAG